MVSNLYKKIHTISVEEILKHEEKLYIEDKNKAEALYELSCFLREIAINNAHQIKDFVIVLRGLKTPSISDNLALYIKSKYNWQLKKDIKRIILRKSSSYGSSTTWELNDCWKKVKASFWLLRNHYYYYDDKHYINVYSISEADLPLFINHEFNSKDKEVYKNRLKGTT